MWNDNKGLEGFIETKSKLSFEDEDLANNVPFVARAWSADEETINALVKKYGPQYNYDKLYEDYITDSKSYGKWRYAKNKKPLSKDRFNKTCWQVLDPVTGKITLLPFFKFNKIKYKIQSASLNPRLVIDWTRRNNVLWVYDTVMVDDVLVFRFYCWSIKYFAEGHKQYFYESHRICLKDNLIWGENREGLYRFNIDYLIKWKNKCAKYMRAKSVNEQAIINILQKYPMTLFLLPFRSYYAKYVKNGKVSFSNPGFSDKLWNDYKSTRDDSVMAAFDSEEGWLVAQTNITFWDFITALSNFCTNTTIYKNVPDVVRKDLGSECIIKNISSFSLYEFDVKKISKNCIKFELGAGGVSLERIYFTSEGMYIFAYNFITNSWASTKKEKLFIADADTPPKILDKLRQLQKTTDTVFNRYVIPNEYQVQHYYRAITLILNQARYLFFEQAAKLGFNNIAFDSDNADMDFIDDELNSIRPITMMPRNCNMADFLGVPGSMLKHLSRNMTMQTAKMFKYKLSHTPYKHFTDKIVASQLMSCNVHEAQVRKIVNTFRREGRDVTSFFRNIISKNIKDNVIDYTSINRIIQYYFDYLQFRVKANKLGNFKYSAVLKPSEIKFMHDRALRDSLYYDDLHAQKANRERTEKFRNVVTADNYKQFEYKGKDFSVISPRLPSDLITEGSVLDHCVGGYVDNVIQCMSKIYFLRRNKCVDEPYYTLEVCRTFCHDEESYLILDDDGRPKFQYALTQCYGMSDTTKKDSATKKFIMDWAKKNKIAIECVV